MVKNEDNSLHFFSTEDLTGMHSVPCKVSCNVCRSPLFDEGRNTVLAYPSSFRFPEHKVPLDFQPTAHIFYSQRVMEIPDGIPKWAGHRGESELLQELTEEEGYVFQDTTEIQGETGSGSNPLTGGDTTRSGGSIMEIACAIESVTRYACS